MGTATRTVVLVVLDDAGRVLGALPPFDVDTPWWMETGEIVAGAAARFGVQATVLRLVHADRPRQPGGTVHYAAQLLGEPYPGLEQVDDELRALAEADDPRRAAYARPGGPQATLAWARATLDELGLGPVLAASQRRTWNLSSIWRLSTPDGTVWLKQVPPFFAHEGAVLGWLQGLAPVPPLIAADGARLLLAHVPGEEAYDADAATRLAIAADMHAIQRRAPVARLLALGVPDRRDLGPRLVAVAGSFGDPADAGLRALVGGLPARLRRVAACGLPDTLVHGDLHSGNAITTPAGARAILDWGDCVVGHPALDILRLSAGLPDCSGLLAAWASWWREAVPGCDPLTAVELMRPVAELYYAGVYADFLAGIETTEQPYHRDDVPEHLARAAALVS